MTTARNQNRIVVTSLEEIHIDPTLELFRKFSPDHPELAERSVFLWQHCNRFVAVLGERIVGHIAQIPAAFLIGGKQVQIGWAATLVIDNTNPLLQAFAGSMLLDRVTKHSALPFSAVGIVPEIESTHIRRGYNILKNKLAMYTRFINPVKALSYLGKPKALATILRGGNALIPQRTSSPDQKISIIDHFEPAWDSQWLQMLSSRYGNFGVRSAELLNYKIAQPGKEYRVFVHKSQGQLPDGYIVFRFGQHRTKDLKLVRICDLVGSKEVKSKLIGLVASYANEVGAYGIVALSSVLESSFFRSSGLWMRKPFALIAPPEASGSIHVSLFDSDLDNLW